MSRQHLPPMLAAALIALIGLEGSAVAQGRGDGDRSDRENRRVERFIELLDTDGDREVSVAEIRAEQERLIAAADVDGNGTLSVDEFRRRGRLFQALGATTLFDLVDVDGDQQLTADELAAPSGRWVTRYDADSSGALNAEELPAGRGRR